MGNPTANDREAVILMLLSPGEKYGRAIRDAYEKETGKKMPTGSLYVTLDRMEKKGFLDSRVGESTHERGGNRRTYYEVTGHGARALQAYELMNGGLGQGGVSFG